MNLFILPVLTWLLKELEIPLNSIKTQIRTGDEFDFFAFDGVSNALHYACGWCIGLRDMHWWANI